MKTTKRRPIMETIFLGIISAIAYILVFSNQEAITTYFTQGGIFAGAVITAALLFSFVYGAFANYFLELLGIEPIKKH